MPVKINGEVIPEQAIDFELSRLVKFYSQHMPKEEVEKQMDALKKRAREQAIGAKLLMDEALRLDLPVTEADIAAKLEEIKKSIGGEKSLEEILKKQKLSMAMIRASIERGRKVDLLIEKVAQEVEEPTEPEMKAHYQAHPAEYAKAEQVQAQHILIRPESDREEEMAIARSRLQEIRERIVEGAAFADEAAAHSDCPSGQRTGGSLGWVSKGMMVPEIDEMLFSIKEGEISEIVESDLGLHIFRTTGREPAGTAAYPEVAESIRDFLRHVRRGEAISAYVEELKKKAVIEDG